MSRLGTGDLGDEQGKWTGQNEDVGDVEPVRFNATFRGRHVEPAMPDIGVAAPLRSFWRAAGAADAVELPRKAVTSGRGTL
ncbi:MAG TPA: hypothetical protein VK395_26430 [Gemmataceae bacterium]|nr:hypothetical protein [Gemmataceae bacterium]